VVLLALVQLLAVLAALVPLLQSQVQVSPVRVAVEVVATLQKVRVVPVVAAMAVKVTDLLVQMAPPIPVVGVEVALLSMVATQMVAQAVPVS
jgi:molybdenum cofactor biosynthesis enzyme